MGEVFTPQLPARDVFMLQFLLNLPKIRRRTCPYTGRAPRIEQRLQHTLILIG